MEKIYNWAILGCGKIARKFSSDLKLLPNANLYAAASRNINNAEIFIKEFGFEKAYGSYEDMVSDPRVDIVYVATPHAFHHKYTLMCLKLNKAVLCEKAFAMNADQVSEMIQLARNRKVFLMEAFWTQFQTSFLKAMEIIKSGELGQLKFVRSDFAFFAPFDPEGRLYNLELGGGSLLDIGIYPVFAALSAFGKPDRIKAFADFAENGSEKSIAMIFKYKNGNMASLSSSFASHSSVQTEYWCEKGYLRLNKRWFISPPITIYRHDDQKEEIIDFDNKQGLGYQYEAAHVMDCLDKGKTESDMLPLDFSLDLMETLDRIRMEAGIYYTEVDK